MKLIHLIPAFNKGGTESIVINLARFQQAYGHNVRIFTFSDLDLNKNETGDLDITRFPDVYAQYHFLRKPDHNLNKMYDELCAFSPDVIHSHAYWTDQLVNAIPKIDTVYISHLHLYYEEFARGFSFSPQRMKLWVGLQLLYLEYRKRHTKFIAISDDLLNYYKRKLPIDLRKNIIKLPNFLRFEPLTKGKSGNISKPLKMLSVGRLDKLKNHQMLLQTARELKLRRIDFRLTIAGEGPERKMLEKTISDWSLQNEVNLIGLIEDLPKLFKEHHLYLHSSKQESFGLAILEAMAHGLPCIVHNSGGPQEFIIHEWNGFFVQNKTEAYLDYILELVQNPTRYQQISEAAIMTAQKYHIKVYYSSLMKIYQL
jgi:glycosyltransferase involved in cell wall biosynthesis